MSSTSKETKGKIRAFVAIELPEELKTKMQDCVYPLLRQEQRLRLTRPENLHITLKFLGNCSPEVLARVRELLLRLAQQQREFRATLRNFGAFPSQSRARIIWVAADSENEDVRRLIDQSEKEFQKIGFERENRESTPHITIARAKTPLQASQLIEQINSASAELFKESFHVSSITLFKSQLRPSGPEYETLFVARFGAKATQVK